MNYVIIGCGVAAVACVEGIRKLDARGSISIISAECRPAYCRPLISYCLRGKASIDSINYRPEEFYTDNNCELIYGSAQSIDARNSKVILRDGRALSYNALCVATGSEPLVPPFAGIENVKARFGFMTAADALALDKAITPDTRALIVGAGLIGLKCAEGICERVKSVTVCDLAPRVLSSVLDDACAARIEKQLSAHGISFMLSDTVERFDENCAHMKSGARVPFDILVLAVGVRPNAALVKQAGGAVERGILVDEYMRTSLERVYAAGDCAQGYDASTDSKRVIAIMPNAYMQGACAGANMAGGREKFERAIPMNAIGFFGLHALSAGAYQGDMFEEVTDSSIKRLFVSDGKLAGFMMIGDVDKAGIYTSLIRERTPLNEIDFDMLKKSPSLMAFSAQYRGKVLGGVV